MSNPRFTMASSTAMADDGHRDERPAPRFQARIKVGFRSIEELVTAYSSDLSQGTLYVASEQQLAPGSDVQLWLELPDELPAAQIAARVQYSLSEAEARAQGRKPGMGVSFLEEDAAPLAERIASLLESSVVEPTDSGAHEPLEVLVVDDSASYRTTLHATLTAAGHRVTTAEHGLAALGLAMKSPPDVVLSDVTMPVMDGWNLLRQLRAREATANVPVVFLTTLDSERDRLRGYALGVDDYIAKPFAEDVLLARVERVVARARREGPGGREETAMSGDLKQVSVISLLSFAEAERRSGVLTLRGPAGEARAGIAGGEVVSVDLPDASAPPALLERLLLLLDWETGRFELRGAEPAAGEERVPVQHALLEHARRKDEGLIR